MKLKLKNKLLEHFGEVEDPRIERSKRHKLIDILMIAILAVVCGADIALREDVRTVFEGGVYTIAKALKLPPALPHPVLEHKPPSLYLVQVR